MRSLWIRAMGTLVTAVIVMIALMPVAYADLTLPYHTPMAGTRIKIYKKLWGNNYWWWTPGLTGSSAGSLNDSESYVVTVLLKYDYIVEECGLTYVVISYPPSLVQIMRAYPPFNVTSTTIDIVRYGSEEKMRRARDFLPRVLSFVKTLEEKYNITVVNATPWPEGIIDVWIYNLRSHYREVEAEVKAGLGREARERGIYIALIEAFYPDLEVVRKLASKLILTYQHYRFEMGNTSALPKLIRRYPASVGVDEFIGMGIMIFNKSVVPTKEDVLEVSRWVRSITGRCDIPIVLEITEPSRPYTPEVPPGPPAPAGFGRSVLAGIGLVLAVVIPAALSVILARRRRR